MKVHPRLCARQGLGRATQVGAARTGVVDVEDVEAATFQAGFGVVAGGQAVELAYEVDLVPAQLARAEGLAYLFPVLYLPKR